MTTMHRKTNRRSGAVAPRRAGLFAAAVATLLLGSSALHVRGQAIVQSGHALDSNLRLGSGGYNGPGYGRSASTLQRGRYDPFGPRSGFSANAAGNYERGAGLSARSINMQRGGLDRYNAFVDARGYDPLRSSVGVGTASPAPVRPPAGPAPVRNSAGFGPGYDRPYEAQLAPGTYEDPAAQHQADALAYGVGFAIGERVRATIDADYPNADDASLAAGFRDAIHENTARMTDEEMEELLQALHERVTGTRSRERLTTDPEFRAEYEQNEETGRRLRDRLAREADIVTLENGLQYRVLVEGTGPSPAETDVVSVRYALLSTEGETVTPPTRARIRLRNTLEGVHIALTMMKVGSVWQVAIPSGLAHGVNGYPPRHGPGVTLYFEVELLSIE